MITLTRLGRLSALALGLTCLCLVGCGQPLGGTGGSATPTASPTQCGSVSQSAAGVVPAHPAAIEHCFFTADQACRPATLAYSWAGVDTSTDHLFATRSHGQGCQITDTAQFHGCCSSVPQNHTATYTCAGAKEMDGRLTILACGDEGDVQLP